MRVDSERKYIKSLMLVFLAEILKLVFLDFKQQPLKNLVISV